MKKVYTIEEEGILTNSYISLIGDQTLRTKAEREEMRVWCNRTDILR